MSACQYKDMLLGYIDINLYNTGILALQCICS